MMKTPEQENAIFTIAQAVARSAINRVHASGFASDKTDVLAGQVVGVLCLAAKGVMARNVTQGDGEAAVRVIIKCLEQSLEHDESQP